jgi:hypothetical protein
MSEPKLARYIRTLERLASGQRETLKLLTRFGAGATFEELRADKEADVRELEELLADLRLARIELPPEGVTQ